MSSDNDENNIFDAASDDEDDWEEVDIHQQAQQGLLQNEPHEPALQQDKAIEITLKFTKVKAEAEKKKGMSHAERMLLIDLHKIHTIGLIVNAKIRNYWLNDELLKARLLSLAPLTLQNEFAMIHKSRIPDQAQRGRAFERAISHLVEWWAHTFFEVLPEGHIRNRTFADLQPKLELHGLLDADAKDKAVEENVLDEIIGEEPEIIRGPKSLMKHALNRSGSRDVSSQLFTSLCRALGIPARLVVSLQSMPWKSSVGKSKSTYKRKGKGKARATEGVEEGEQSAASSSKGDIKGQSNVTSFQGEGNRLDGTSVPKSEKAKGKEKAQPLIKLRKQKAKGRRLDEPSPSTSRLASPDPTTTPPVFWTEVFSRADGRWIPIDPIRAIVNKRKVFDPTPVTSVPGTTDTRPSSSLFPLVPKKSPINPQRGFKEENRMLYVLAFEEDCYARDVTPRYAREYSAKIVKAQGGSTAIGGGGKARQAWWENVTNLVKRPYQLQRDDVEDDELATAQMAEGMPTTITGFKDHPLYALERHLKQTEVIHPPPPETRDLGKFRGESVYPRSSVVSLKTSETWMRTEGRMIIPGCQPLKTIKARPGTLNRQRELEVFKDELRDAGHDAEGSAGDVMQGLYAHFQTEVYVPEPIFDGKIPKNRFGNIDLYTPSMLPHGAAHVPFKGVAKIARKLGFDYAEAVTGFEFRKRRANPVVEGIVVAAENESALLEAYWEAQKIEEEKARVKKEEKALQHWMKLVNGLRIRQRLQDQYSGKSTPGPSATKGAKSRKTSSRDSSGLQDAELKSKSYGADQDSDDEGLEPVDTNDSGGGGFLVEAGDVIEAFHLPKYNPLLLLDSSSSNPFAKRHTGGQGPTANGHELDPSTSKGEQDTQGNDKHEDGGPIDFVTYDLDEDLRFEVALMDPNEQGSERPPKGSPGPPLTAFSTPISLAAAAAGLQDDENDDLGDTVLSHDKPRPRTMQDLLDAEAEEKGVARAGDFHSTLNLDGVSGEACSSKGSSGPNAGPTAIIGEGETGRQLRSGRSMVINPSGVSPVASSVAKASARAASRVTRGARRKSNTNTPKKAAGGEGKKVAIKTSGKRKRGKRRADDEEDDEDDNDDVRGDVRGLGEGKAEEDSHVPRKRRKATPETGEEVVEELRVNAAAAPPVTSSSSGRTLRPRRNKTVAQLEEEKEAEKAFREAVAQ